MKIKQIFSYLYIVRAAFIGAALLASVLAFPTQVHEIYRAVSVALLDNTIASKGLAFSVIASVLAASFFFSSLSYALIEHHRYVVADPNKPRDSIQKLTPNILSAVVGVLPLLGLTVGVAISVSADLSSDSLIPILAGEGPPQHLAFQDSFLPQLPQFMNDYKLSIEVAAKEILSAVSIREVAVLFLAGICCLVFVLIVFSVRIPLLNGRSVFSFALIFSLIIVTICITAFIAFPGVLDASDKLKNIMPGLEGVAASSISLSRILGLIGISSVFFILSTYFLSCMFRAFDKLSIPILSSLIVALIVFSWAELNDNHTVRKIIIPPKQIANANPETVQASKDNELTHLSELSRDFTKWLQRRPDYIKNKFAAPVDSDEAEDKSRPFPIVIVAAQGGGIYAANLTALALSRLYHRCPAIAHHVFAVSALSGGALGAAAFAAAQRELSFKEVKAVANENVVQGLNEVCHTNEVRNDGASREVEQLARRFLQEDFIAPIAAAGLFPDFVQRFIPLAVPALDRARAFELAIEDSWNNVRSADGEDAKSIKNYMSLGLKESWQPDIVHRPWPMLILTATKPSQGSRVAFLPRKMRNEKHTRFEPATYEINADEISSNPNVSVVSQVVLPSYYDIRLSTAIGVSARFPLILPPANFGSPQFPLRLVDGGYFENTAIETALDLVDQLVEELKFEFGGDAAWRKKYAFHLLILTETDRDAGEWSLNEIGGHLQALLMTRVRRAHLARYKQAPRSYPNIEQAFTIELDRNGLNLPFGLWQSVSSQELVAQQVGLKDVIDEEACENTFSIDELKRTDWFNEDSSLHEALAMLHSNNCTYLKLLKVIRGDKASLF